ncbi:MAG: hypothetical protein ACE5IY_15475 [bacterium]
MPKKELFEKVTFTDAFNKNSYYWLYKQEERGARGNPNPKGCGLFIGICGVFVP